MKRVCLSLALAFAAIAFAADKPAAPVKPETAAAAPAKPQTLPVADADRADIRELQLRADDLLHDLQDAQRALAAKINACTPKGYQLQEDQQKHLSYAALPEPKPDKPEKAEKTK